MRNYPEYADCIAYYQWAKYKRLDQYLIHHPNEGKRSFMEGARLKAIGLRKGLPDYQFILPNEKYHSFWLEMKTKAKQNHKMPLAQVIWISNLKDYGHFASFAFGFEHAVELTLSYLENRL